MPDDLKLCFDRMLADDLQSKAYEVAIEENPGNVAPVGVAMDGDAPTRDYMALVAGKKWRPGRTLRIAFLDGVHSVQERVRRYAMQWTRHANIRFQFVNARNADVRVSFGARGSWSYIGTDALLIDRDQPTMNFGWLTPQTPDHEYSRVVLHEFGHMLGSYHEHQHPDTDIPWDREAVYQYYGGPPNYWSRADVDRNLFRKYERTISQFSQFDPDSIMLYPIPNSLTMGDYEVGWNTVLSPTDTRFIAVAYPREQKRLRLVAIHCSDTEDWTGDDEAYLRVDGRRVWQQNMGDGENVDLTGLPPIRFEHRARVELFDEDTGALGDADDHLGTLYVHEREANQGVLQHDFHGQGAHYQLTYEVL